MLINENSFTNSSKYHQLLFKLWELFLLVEEMIFLVVFFLFHFVL